MLKHSGHVSLRERLLRFNVAVLRVVAAACAGLPHSKQVKARRSRPPPVCHPHQLTACHREVVRLQACQLRSMHLDGQKPKGISCDKGSAWNVI